MIPIQRGSSEAGIVRGLPEEIEAQALGLLDDRVGGVVEEFNRRLRG